MHKKLIVVAVAALIIPTYLAQQQYVTLNMLEKTFPEIDRKVLKKAYNIMFKDTLAGKHPEVETMTDDELNAMLLTYVHALNEN